MIGPGDLFGRGMAFPPRVGPDGRVAWSEGQQNIEESIQLILLTAAGERLRLPTFGGGVERFLMEPNTDETRFEIGERIRQGVTDWEPRVTVQTVQVDPHPTDAHAAIATLVYKLVATQGGAQMSLAVTLAG
jgi:phage baseplate assembly protein W